MASVINIGKRLFNRPWSHARSFPSSGFEILDKTKRVEEEAYPWYKPSHYYPVRIGDIYHSKYQVIAKLGIGGYSTTWLCRDLANHRYIALKVCTSHAPDLKREVKILDHINSIKSTHPGLKFMRKLIEHFELANEEGTYQCLVHDPMSTTLGTLRSYCHKERLDEALLQILALQLLYALDFLHTEARVIHGDIQENNILLNLKDESVLRRVEEQEMTNPVPRKVLEDRVIYASVVIKPKKWGEPILCDFGEARTGKAKYTGDLQPIPYRAPEVILGMAWDEKVDIWNLGVMMWDLFENKMLFIPIGARKGVAGNRYHLSHMITHMGLPPLEFLQRAEGDIPWRYFNEDGNWKMDVKIPDGSLEKLEENLQGERKKLFLAFMRRILKWKPEDRPKAKELINDPWLTTLVD